MVTDEVVIAAVVVEAVYTVKDDVVVICRGRSGDDVEFRYRCLNGINEVSPSCIFTQFSSASPSSAPPVLAGLARIPLLSPDAFKQSSRPSDSALAADLTVLRALCNEYRPGVSTVIEVNACRSAIIQVDTSMVKKSIRAAIKTAMSDSGE